MPWNRTVLRWRPLLVAALLVGACSARGEEPEAAMGADRDLVASLDVRFQGDTVQFGLHVTNGSLEPVVAEFSSGQRYDFIVRTLAGEEVWRWSADRGFTQALGEETVAPGGWLQYREDWNAGARTGRYVAEARLTSLNRPIVLRMEFELPAR
jgi:hypothetical protein